MNKTKDFKTELKLILNSKWCVAFLLMLTSFFYDVVLFSKNGPFIFTFFYCLFLCFYYFSWLLSLYLGRFISSVILIVNFVFFCVLKEYYKFHTIPLKFEVVKSLYKDGLIAGFKNTHSLFDNTFFVFLCVLFFSLFIINRKSFYSLKKFIILSLVSLLLIVPVFNLQRIWHIEIVMQWEYPKLFFSYQQGMLYKFRWVLEQFLPKNNQVHNTIMNGNFELRNKMKSDNIFLSHNLKNIYLIQVESLTTKAFQNMPFLSTFISSDNSKYYIDKKHDHCIGSANTDFMVMTGLALDCFDAYVVVYYSYPSEIYSKIESIASVLKKKGYKTFFFHNYSGKCFNRRNHYTYMGFDAVYFEENFSKNIERNAWGIDDYNFFKIISSHKEDENKFYFIVTSGMHPPYNVNENIPNQSSFDAYLSSVKILDDGIKYLYEHAENDSLFIIYGDHNVPDLNAFDTPLLLIYKGDKNLKINGEKKDGFNGTIYYINSLFN